MFQLRQLPKASPVPTPGTAGIVHDVFFGGSTPESLTGHYPEAPPAATGGGFRLSAFGLKAGQKRTVVLIPQSLVLR